MPAPTCRVIAQRSTPRAASACEQLGVEVQRRGRRRDRARLRREHRLVATLVVGAVVAGDVGRQRHVAVALEQLERIVGKAQLESEPSAPPRPSTSASKPSPLPRRRRLPGLRRLARAQLREHAPVGLDPLDQGLDRAAARLRAEQARLDDPGVVDDQQVAFAQQPRQVAEGEVARRFARAVEQPRAAALGGGMLRDQLRRQREIEIAERVASGRRRRNRHRSLAGGQNSPMLPSSTERAGPAPGRAVTAADKALAKLGLVRDIDLALHLPLRYEDETTVIPIAALRDGETGQVEAVVSDSKIQFRPRRQLVVTLKDEHGDDLVLRFLHFYPSTQKTLAVGKRVRARGEARGGFFGLEMVHPSFKVVAPGAPLPTSLTPVYPSTVQLSQAVLRKAVAAGLARADLDEIVPPSLMPRSLPTLREALRRLHEPAPGLDAQALEDRSHPAWQRLKFDELLAQQLSQLQAKREREAQRAPAFATIRGGRHDALLRQLPFPLTAAQRRVAGEIGADLARPLPMHRLLQGDVGSGKTVIAALAACIAIDAGWQCALMAPTEILAEQHLRKLVGWLAPLGITVAWLTGSRKGKARTKMLEQVASGEAALVVGTHAVIEEQVRFARLGLAIVDEQHRFGVSQRLALREKLQEPPREGERGGGGPIAHRR